MKLENFKIYIHPEEEIVLRDYDNITFERFFNNKSELTDKELELEVVNCYTVPRYDNKLVIKVVGLQRINESFEVGDYVELFDSLFKYEIVYLDTDGLVVKNTYDGRLRLISYNDIERKWI